jgi:hypothetical protein
MYHKLASSCPLAPVDVDVERRTWSKWKMMYPSIDQLDKSEARHISANRRRRGRAVLCKSCKKQWSRYHPVMYS